MKLRVKRKKHMGKPAAILSADWHLRDDKPLCRTDDYWVAQWEKVNAIFKLADELGVPILIAGDLGHKPEWSNRLLSVFIAKCKEWEPDIYFVPGQHDLPNHNLEDYDISGCAVLSEAEVVRFGEGFVIKSVGGIDSFPYGKPMSYLGGSISIIHQMVIKDKPLWPGQVAQTGREMLQKCSGYKLIVTGDNHMPFVIKYKNRLLVNPGSLTRMTAAQIDHKPRVYIWYPESNTAEAYYFPVRKADVSKRHIKDKVEKDKRLEAFVSSLRSQGEVGLSFEKNMERFLNDNKVSKRVREKIWDATR